MKKDFVLPIVVLFSICLVVAAALALTDTVTAPLIAAAQEKAAEAARMEVLPEADSFVRVELEELPEGVTDVYRAQNGVGFVFMLSAKGYGGTMKLICGIDNAGSIVACKTLSHAETQGLGSKTADKPFREQFIGQNRELDGVSAISGATVSSKAYIDAIEKAFIALDLVKEAG